MVQILLLSGYVGGKDQGADLFLQRGAESEAGWQLVQEAALNEAAHRRAPVVVL